MSRKGFSHSAEVVSIGDGNAVELMIVSATACDGCHAKGSCGASGDEEGRQRVVRVVSDLAPLLKVGERVELSIKYGIGAYAIILAYVVPLFLFVGSIGISIAVGVDDGVAALIGFAVAAIYYCGVYAMRKRTEQVVKFELRRYN
ncbi:MAG: SoxR reducing system RseC family protein [Rikenellaceae bacterium]